MRSRQAATSVVALSRPAAISRAAWRAGAIAPRSRCPCATNPKRGGNRAPIKRPVLPRDHGSASAFHVLAGPVMATTVLCPVLGAVHAALGALLHPRGGRRTAARAR